MLEACKKLTNFFKENHTKMSIIATLDSYIAIVPLNFPEKVTVQKRSFPLRISSVNVTKQLAQWVLQRQDKDTFKVLMIIFF